MTQAGIRQHPSPSSLDTGAWQGRQLMDFQLAGVQHRAGNFQGMAFHPNPQKPKDDTPVPLHRDASGC